ncbi:MAG: energy transducer TonB [Acidobacteriota bacterium]
MPSDYGTLDAVTSVIFRVEFLSDGDIGQVAWVKGSHIQRLDELASAAVHRIKFIPTMVDGSPIRTFKMVRYRYSWEYGWRVNGLTCKGTSKDKTQ